LEVEESTIGCIVAAIDGPKITSATHDAAAGAAAKVGGKKAATTGAFFERFWEERHIEKRYGTESEGGSFGYGVLFGDDVEFFCTNGPPDIGRFAVCDRAVVKDVAIFDLVGPFSFEQERIVGAKEAWTREGWGRGSAFDLEEGSGLFLDIVFCFCSFESFAAVFAGKTDLASGFGVLCLFVIVNLLGFERHALGFDDDVASEKAHWTFSSFCFGTDLDVVGLCEEGCGHKKKGPRRFLVTKTLKYVTERE